MNRRLPPPVTASDEYAAALLDAIDNLGIVLGDIRDRLPAPAGPVTVAEPAPADVPDAQAVPVSEPAPLLAPRKQTPTRRNGKGR